MENNRTDRQPRTVDFSLFDQIEKAVPAYDLDKAIQKRATESTRHSITPMQSIC